MTESARLLLAALFAGLVLSAPGLRQARADDDAKTKLRLIQVDGQTGVRLDEQTLRKNPIAVALLHAAPWRNQVRGYGTVLDPARLIDTVDAIAAAKAAMQAAQARLTASKTGFERARALYAGQQNISLAELQSAEAAYRGDQAGLAAAASKARSLAMTASLDFGSRLGAAIKDELPPVEDLLSGKQYLVQVTPPQGFGLKAPPSATVREDRDSPITMTFLSPASVVDPRLQTPGLFYLAPASGSILPGMNLLVSLPNGPVIQGVVVPAAAIVWWENRAWAYHQAGPDLFVRTPIATDLATGDGGYVVRNLARTPVVISGAQLLLSEEFRSQIQSDDD